MVLLDDSSRVPLWRWEYVRVTIGFLVSSLTKALHPRMLSVAGQPGIGSLGGSKLLPFKNDGGHCVLGRNLMLQKCFGTLP